MTLPPELASALTDSLGDEVAGAVPVSGGDINDAWRVELASGTALFVKSRRGAEGADFEAEAAGLRWLAAAGAPVPAVVGTGSDPAWFALRWIEPGALSERGSEELGRALAALHRSGADAYCELPPLAPDAILRIGSVRLEVAPRSSWQEAYAEELVLPLARLARDSGALSDSDAAAVEGVCERIDELAGPSESPARLHGDLWGGNVMGDERGAGVLIDPAAYAGHREMDLAMLRLFGSPSPRILAAYAEAHPLAEGHAERVELWQLLPLLVHAVIFGGGYGARAGAAARRYL